jgi:hypothetical protein
VLCEGGYVFVMFYCTYILCLLFGTLAPSDLRAVGDSPFILVCIRRYCHICCFFLVLVVFLYGVGCSEDYSGVNVFEYFGNLLCFVSKECECNPFILLVGIFFGVSLVRYNVAFA